MWGNILRSGYLEPEDRFKLHGLKHRGISDTEGTLADAREGAGHKTEQMTARYRHKVSRVRVSRAHIGVGDVAIGNVLLRWM